MSAAGPVDLEAVQQAAVGLEGQVEHTPCVYSRTLSAVTGAEVYLKLENLQFTSSFKERGALVKLLSLSEAERARGVVAMSAGNHAQAVAYHAQRLGIPAVIVMPRHTPTVKVEHTRAFGAEVHLEGEDFEEAAAVVAGLVRERGLTLVHPYDDPAVIAGQGSVALEMLADRPELEALVIPVGGGGLIGGCAVAARGLRPGVEVLGVETARFPAVRTALEGGEPEFGRSTIAEGIAVKRPGALTLPLIREHVSEVLLVDEAELEQAVLLLLEVEKTVAEGAAAAPLAALLRHRPRFAGRRVGLVVSGGNIDLPILSAIIQRGLVRSQRMVRLLVTMRDRPGALAEAADLIGRLGANIAEVQHQRTFSHLPLESVEVAFTVHTRGADHVGELLQGLEAAGHAARLAPESEAV